MVKTDKIWNEELDAKIQSVKEKQHLRGERIRGVERGNVSFTTLPRKDQLLPPQVQEFMENGLVLEPNEERPSIEVPAHFYGFKAPETIYMINLLSNSSDLRVRKMMSQIHTRALFKEDRYYQISDDPELYMAEADTRNEFPLFGKKTVMYLTASGLAIYMKNVRVLQCMQNYNSSGIIPRAPQSQKAREARQPKRKLSQSIFEAVTEHEESKKSEYKHMFNVNAYQYATFVHSAEGDILRFQLDYLAYRRNVPEAMTYLLQMGYQPNDPSVLMYRRRFYQYATPFLDWVDVMRYLIKRTPTIVFTDFYKTMINSSTRALEVDNLKYLGKTMLECFEMRRLTNSNCKSAAFVGLYVGRKILKDKEPQTHADYKEAFGKGQAVRPVIPHACSALRRFLTHLYYYDKSSMSTLSQMLACTRYMLSVDFFVMHPLVKRSTIHRDPMIFQIYDFVWLIKKSQINSQVFLRNETWQTIVDDMEGYAWYRRYDVLNCICLLFGVLQNALLKDLNDVTIDNIVHIIIEALISSEYLEAVMSYSFYDTYFGLTSTTNCVPNLQSRCVLRVLKKIPLYLVENYPFAKLMGFLSPRFWKPSDGQGKIPKTIEEVGEYLVIRNRKLSMKTASEGGGEAVSGTSAMGAGGAVTLFYRNFDDMIEISAVDEQAMDNDRNDNTRKEEEERVHVADYTRQEIDYRYSQVFTDSFFQAMGRPRIFFDELVQYKLSAQRSKDLFKPKE